jgi:hypothetical protein
LDEIDAIEALEAEQAANMSGGRRKKDSARKALAAAAVAPKRGRKRVDDDEDFDFRKPLQEGGLKEIAVQKTTWGSGSGALRERTNTESSLPDDKSLRSGALAVAKAPRRGEKTRTDPENRSPPAKVQTPEEIGGANLLARLLSKGDSTASTRTSSDPLSSSRTFSSLGSADDIFGYLHTGTTGKTPSVDFGEAPFAVAGGAADGVEELSDEEHTTAGKKGRGRPKADDNTAAKKQRRVVID